MFSTLSLAILLITQPVPASEKQQASPRDYENQILDAERSGDVKVFDKLLAESCITIGPDGKRRSKAELIEIIRTIPKQNVTASDFLEVPAGRDVVLVNYVVTSLLPDGKSRQHTATSVWVRRRGRWIMQFHQGTEIPQ